MVANEAHHYSTKGYPVSYISDKQKQARDLVGKRVEVPVHYDVWMRGARYGVVRSLWWQSDGVCAGVKVKLDHPQARRLLRVHRIDLDYIKVL